MLACTTERLDQLMGATGSQIASFTICRSILRVVDYSSFLHVAEAR